MKTRGFHPGQSINSRTNHDILFNIMIKLDVQYIILLWFSANNSSKYWRKNDNITEVLKDHSFWQTSASYHLQSQQLVGVTDFQKLMLDRYEAYKIIEKELDNSIYYKKSWLYSLTGEYDGLPGVSIQEIGNLLCKCW